jgi:hypothetical protein
MLSLVEQRGAFSVLVTVGQEEAPWYCSEWPDYVAFEFTAAHPSDPLAKRAGSDVFKMVHLGQHIVCTLRFS